MPFKSLEVPVAIAFNEVNLLYVRPLNDLFPQTMTWPRYIAQIVNSVKALLHSCPNSFPFLN